jgi:hypothetical protein
MIAGWRYRKTAFIRPSLIRARLRFLGVARSPSPHLPEDDPVFLRYLRPESLVTHRLAVMRSLSNEMKIVFAQLMPKAFPVGEHTLISIPPQHQVFIVRREPG